MTIIRASIRRVSLPLAVPFVTALRRVDAAEFIVLEFHTDSGLRAYGSAPATKAVTGETLESIEAALNTHILPALIGEPFVLETLLQKNTAALEGNRSAKAAADMALYSLAAQAKDVPLYRFLGAKAAAPVTTAVTVSLAAPDAMRLEAKALFDRGFDILKIKVGSDDGNDFERIRGIAESLPGATLLVDANQAWNVRETLFFLERAAGLAIALIEQPVAGYDIEGLAEITKRSPFPILADEAVFDAADARRVLERGAADLINIKLMKCGGISGALEMIDVCQEHGVQCMLGSMLEGPVSITAALHLAVAFPERFAWIDLDSPLLYRTLPPDLAFRVERNRYAL